MRETKGELESDEDADAVNEMINYHIEHEDAANKLVILTIYAGLLSAVSHVVESTDSDADALIVLLVELILLVHRRGGRQGLIKHM